jgi:hypothetical protein
LSRIYRLLLMSKIEIVNFCGKWKCFHIHLISRVSRFFYSFLKRASNSNICISRNITWNIYGCISRSKLAFPQYNKCYLSVIAFIVFTSHEIKQRKFFLGHPVVTSWGYIFLTKIIFSKISQELPIFLDLFHRGYVTLTFKRFTLFKPYFSEICSNARRFEGAAYSIFLQYLREAGSM